MANSLKWLNLMAGHCGLGICEPKAPRIHAAYTQVSRFVIGEFQHVSTHSHRYHMKYIYIYIMGSCSFFKGLCGNQTNIRRELTQTPWPLRVAPTLAISSVSCCKAWSNSCGAMPNLRPAGLCSEAMATWIRQPLQHPVGHHVVSKKTFPGPL